MFPACLWHIKKKKKEKKSRLHAYRIWKYHKFESTFLFLQGHYCFSRADLHVKSGAITLCPLLSLWNRIRFHNWTFTNVFKKAAFMILVTVCLDVVYWNGKSALWQKGKSVYNNDMRYYISLQQIVWLLKVWLQAVGHGVKERGISIQFSLICIAPFYNKTGSGFLTL